MIHYIKRNTWLLFLLVPAFLIYLLIIFPSGTNLCFQNKCGIYFWGVHGHDGVWHLAIAAASFAKIPFINPTFAGAALSGYNYLLDFFVYLISRLGIPPVFTYFKILPIVWFILFTGLLISLARKIKDSPIFVGIFLFFVYFAESFSYVLRLMHHKTIWGSADLLATLKVHMMSNPPFAFSLLIVLPILIFIQRKKMDLKTITIMAFLNFLNLGLKFYGGAVTSFLIFIYLIFSFVKDRNLKKLLLYSLINAGFLLAAILLFYDPFSSLKSGSIFSFAPFALIHTITEEPELFYMHKLTDARYFLISKGISPKLILIELFNLGAFLFFYLGVKFFGLLYVLYKLLKKKLTQFEWYVILTMIFATILTATFVQKAQWWNVIQFFYYAIFLSSIFAAELVFALLKKKNIFIRCVVIIALVLAIPITFDVIKNNAIFPGVSYIPQKELEALTYLKKQSQGVVLTPLYNRALKNSIAPNEMYRYEDTAYVSAFSNHPVYFADITQLGLTGVNYGDRLKKIKNNDCSILSEIDYFYYLKQLPEARKLIDCNPSRFLQLFSNEAAVIYSLKK